MIILNIFSYRIESEADPEVEPELELALDCMIIFGLNS